jgi:hypothetical protein
MDAAGRRALWMIFAEATGWLQRVPVHRVAFSGVFERHPNLKLLFVEQRADW